MPQIMARAEGDKQIVPFKNEKVQYTYNKKDRALRLNNVEDFFSAVNGKKTFRNPAYEKKVRKRRRMFGIALAAGGLVSLLYA